jgi:lipopolysaccharide biosynthesis regulator YciM
VNLIDYNDPLFSIIAILLMLLVTALATHFLGQYKRYREQRTLQNLIKKYDFIASDDAIVKVIKDGLLPHETIFFIASSFEKSGDYERSITIYVELLNTIHSKAEQVPVLFRLGVVYYKAGFMQRALDVFLRLVRINYSHIEALEYLVLIYDKLKDYPHALEVLEPLDELGHDTRLLEGYVRLKLMMSKFENNYDEMIAIVKDDIRLSRVVIDHFLKIDASLVWKYSDILDFHDSIDLFWQLDESKIDISKASQSHELSELLGARGLVECQEYKQFEYEQMSHNHKHKIKVSDLGFEYVCRECKRTSPLYSSRCHSCNALLSFEVVPVIIKRVDFNQVKGFYEGN